MLPSLFLLPIFLRDSTFFLPIKVDPALTRLITGVLLPGNFF